MEHERLLGTPLPVIQAPMAGVQGHALAAAVSNAGGLGSLPCAVLGPEALRGELAALREHTDRPYSVNFFCHTVPVFDAARDAAWQRLLSPYFAEFAIDPDAIVATPGRVPFDDAAAHVLAEFRPAIVSFHFGLPQPHLLERVRACGATVLATATTVDEARWLQAHGTDAVIVQGSEAGGHRGNFLGDDLDAASGTFTLLREVVSAVDIPVIAAGGIADARGIAHALALGAVAAQVGTAYLLCPEATTSAVHRAALASESATTTAITNLFTGRPARGIVNRLMRELGPIRAEVPAFPLAAAALAPLRARAERLGRGDFSPLWAGGNAASCRETPAALLTRELAGLAQQAV